VIFSGKTIMSTGEIAVFSADHVLQCLPSAEGKHATRNGDLFITNYRVIFSESGRSTYDHVSIRSVNLVISSDESSEARKISSNVSSFRFFSPLLMVESSCPG
jgi:hypothetical protein